ncbi:MAG TPA: exosortase/archaeosortase family protein [Gemmataceae bacterium]|jgi:exosortase|nr:exosortase/archaeosortase family protein [Gemmataceae bacterium]
MLVAAASAYAFWPTLAGLYSKWVNDPQYSHGLLVAPFAIGLLWAKRERFPVDVRPAPLPGLILLAIAVAGHVLGGVIYFKWLEAFTLLPFVAGLMLTFGGFRVLLWALPAIAFLVFMIPMPYTLEIQLGAPLQTVATIASTYVLQTLGQPALAEGNTILIKDFKLGIVEACSGLRMLVTFITFSTAVCMVVRKPMTDKLLILLSAIPIALLVNITRIVLTGLMYLYVNGQTAHVFFHDLAGWFMMPMALAMLWVELWVLRHLFTEMPPRVAIR